VASQKSKRRSRKPQAGRRAAPRAVASGRRLERAERQAGRRRATAQDTTGAVGERPASPFGGLPISELAIFAGIVGLVVGLITGGEPAMVVGAIVCGLGVTEVTAREHFSGFRSHCTLLAAVPAVVAEVAFALFVGVPSQRVLLLGPLIVVWVPCFWLLRRTFRTARHARLARPPAP
jgi:hypothetical protein